MNIQENSTALLNPKNQLNLFGYERYLNSFVKLFENKQMPNSILLSGLKGSGKATFAYHFINYLLSKNEKNKYSINDNNINKDNLSYKNLCAGTHPNFFLLECNNLEKDIKIDNVRNLLKFTSKSTYSQNLKIIMIDNAERLNLNSSNALLKIIEEPSNNTYFFIIHDNAFKILSTIKSRAIVFNFFFKFDEKKNILKRISKQYKIDTEIDKILNDFYFDSPGNLVKYILELKNSNLSILKNKLSCIYYFIDIYKKEKNYEILSFLTIFIEKFYNDLCCVNDKKINTYLLHQSQILKQIFNMKKFNLSEKNTLLDIKNILSNDAK